MSVDERKHLFVSPKLEDLIRDAMSFFEKTPLHPLAPAVSFIGPGTYALYYVGDRGSSDPYGILGRLNKSDCLQPIYVGKAVPPGTRTARVSISSSSDLYRRLREHAGNLEQVGFRLSDFRTRFMIMQNHEAAMIATVESALFRKYQPIWNCAVDGFGNHDPGAGRYEQANSEWDVLHPGRTWANRLKGRAPSRAAILAKVEKLMSKHS